MFKLTCAASLLALLVCACAPKQPPESAASTAPAETMIDVCVVDTIAPGGMMAISAIAVHAAGDTVILQPEGRVNLNTALAGPKVLSQASWLSSKQLQLTSATARLRFIAQGQPRAFAPGKIALLGMMRGVPVFAKPTEGGRMRAEVESLAARGVDLEKALLQRSSLRRQLDRVRTLYIPTQLAGCRFQQFTRVTERRK